MLTLPHSSAARSKGAAYENVLDLDDEQLRGISLSALLSNGARLFARHGAAAREDPSGTFALSYQCDSLNYFCSHSWTTSRWLKYVALIVHFNLGRALVATLLANYACLIGQLWFKDYTPSWIWAVYPIQPDMASGMAPLGAEMLIPLVFFFVLCTAHLVSPVCSLFLDIACIRQDSEAAKADGIASLGAVLDRSERMLVLCDANYFSRLWCTFELAAYSKRAGSHRIDLLPLHEPLVLIGMVADISCFLVVGSVLGALLPQEVMESDDMALIMPLFTALIDAPAQIFIIFSMVQAYEGQQAIAKLARFKLSDAQCHSDEDRQELQQLIAKWFTEATSQTSTSSSLSSSSSGTGSSGDKDDAEALDTARRVGFHRFEQFVRHTVAPTLISNRSSYLSLMVTTSVIALAPLFDMMCSEAFTANHLTAYVAVAAIGFAILVPLKLFVYWRSAGVVLALRERCRCPAPLAYTVGILLNFFGALPMLLLFAATGPTSMVDPSYKLPDDGLGPLGHKMLATQAGGVLAAIAGCAVVWMFKF